MNMKIRNKVIIIAMNFDLTFTLELSRNLSSELLI